MVYELDRERGRLEPRPERTVRLPPGSGPRHIAFAPEGRFAYLMNEMSATITAFAYDADAGGLEEIQTIDALPEGFAGHRSGAAIAVHPSGFLYATTRSHGSSGEPPVRGVDSLVWFALDRWSGRLALAGRIASGGEIPRAIAFEPGGERLFVAHQASAAVTIFRLDGRTGTPTPTGEAIGAPVPVCLLFNTPN
jgi:6-phosphogluconolactonase